MLYIIVCLVRNPKAEGAGPSMTSEGATLPGPFTAVIPLASLPTQYMLSVFVVTREPCHLIGQVGLVWSDVSPSQRCIRRACLISTSITFARTVPEALLGTLAEALADASDFADVIYPQWSYGIYAPAVASFPTK